MTDIIQGSAEWHEARRGKATASQIAAIMSQGRSGKPSATRANYEALLVAERLTGTVAESFKNSAMDWGNEQEPAARIAYEFLTDNPVEEVSFVDHPTIDQAGASPDGLIGTDGLVEIKCPNTATHINTLLGGAIPTQYIKQMQFQMACTGRLWCDFVSFDLRLPAEMQLWIKRLDRDAALIVEIETAVKEFLGDVEATISALQLKYGEVT